MQQIIVAVNKLDNVGYREERYTFIKDQLKPFLTKSGFRPSDVQFIPCSAFKGENLVTISDTALSSWYQVKIKIKYIKYIKSRHDL